MSHKILYQLMKEQMVLVPGRGWRPIGVKEPEPIPVRETKESGSSNRPEGGKPRDADLSQPGRGTRATEATRVPFSRFRCPSWMLPYIR